MAETKVARAASPEGAPTNFIRQAIDADIAAGRVPDAVVTRFPPEPNGYLHIGHAKSICLNFGIARDYPGAVCRLRFDDTNPTKERVDFMEEIQADVRWLGFDWGDRPRHASDYFEPLCDYAVRLIESGNAYVCSLRPEEIRAGRGTLTEPGSDSPHRSRSVEENLELFARMRSGELAEGAHVLRAKIDMASPNLNLRDPVIYRIVHAPHPLTGRAWCVYPMYDFAQALSDTIEGVTHSLCTLEFEDHRPLYEWFLEKLEIPSPPRQIEFGRLNLTHTVMSKRYLTRLVDGGWVNGWDDPRMPTIAGMRRRGFTPEALRDFCERIGVTKNEGAVEFEMLENCVRADLEPRTRRAMAVLRPLRLVIENYPEDGSETFEAPNHPNDPALGTRTVPFSRELFIERDDFMEDPPRKFFRFAPGPRGPAALRLPRHLHGCREGSFHRGGGRDSRPLRPRFTRGQGARRPQGQGHRPLGVRPAGGPGVGAALRPPVPGSGAGARRGAHRRRDQSGVARSARIERGRAVARARFPR